MTKATLSELFERLYDHQKAFRTNRSNTSFDAYNKQLLEILEDIRKLTPDKSPDFRKEMARIAQSRGQAVAQATARTAEATAPRITQLEGAAETASTQAQSWINRVGKGKVALGAAGAIAAVGLGVLAWKEYVAKPDAGPQAHAK